MKNDKYTLTQGNKESVLLNIIKGALCLNNKRWYERTKEGSPMQRNKNLAPTHPALVARWTKMINVTYWELSATLPFPLSDQFSPNIVPYVKMYFNFWCICTGHTSSSLWRLMEQAQRRNAICMWQSLSRFFKCVCCSLRTGRQDTSWVQARVSVAGGGELHGRRLLPSLPHHWHLQSQICIAVIQLYMNPDRSVDLMGGQEVFRISCLCFNPRHKGSIIGRADLK